MTTVILAEKPGQARSYVQPFQKRTKNRVTIRLATLF
ncbi:DNA topoisomerase III [Lactiplantibacillus plantarum]|nr:DNA topoisomerase III [Lactiplantibacillus plantarum]MCG0814197.1 DNA topoisomerase III [Lactiplantibacillus plantarum]MCG0879569.1 DNA topoisomerase III [Lactiplantibacillus plantarum]MCG0952089.1 DNA topoisomerase III [Lactiplantibacillus plantarum]